MTRAALTDLAKLKQHGYRVERFDPCDPASGWCLLDPEGANLMIGESYGCIAPTQWEAVAEGVQRIEQDERCEALAGVRFLKVLLTDHQHAALEAAARTCIEQWDGDDRQSLDEQYALHQALAALAHPEPIR